MKKQRIFIKTNYSLLLGLILMLSGFNLMSEKEKAWTTYSTKDGLAFNHVVGIAVDTDNVKWFGTAAGASSYDKK